MKLRYFYLLLLAVVAFTSSCEKHNFADGVLSPITSIEDIRDLYKGQDVVIAREDLLGAEMFGGMVISNQDSANIENGLVVMQNSRRSRTRGIILSLPNSGDYKMGDSLMVNVVGATLTKVNGSLELKNFRDSAITIVSRGKEVIPQSTSSYSINLRPGDYESTLVQIKGATVNPSPSPDATFAGEYSLVNGADSLILHTEEAASFAGASIPATATFSGILRIFESADGPRTIKLWPRTQGDIIDRIAPPDPEGPELGEFPVFITGFVSDAKGGDGNYEYFQFIATEDIDFEKTPMAVVTCTNAGSATPYAGNAPAGGWATGGGRTYKFNLASGTVSKGEFFYVGGGNKRINGANSTSIANAKWITAIDYNVNDGDGFGAKSGGLLPNSGNAGGIAIFKGINITETSVPSDAIFYGGKGKGTIYNETDGFGYRVPKNEHYNPVDESTLTDQPFFFQGTNQYIIPHQLPADLGMFTKLGGVFDSNTKTWTTPRGHEFYLMSQTSELSEIETSGVTRLVD